MTYLGVDTSNYRTSLAFYDADSRAARLSSRLLPVAKGERGLRQSDALFAHTKALPELTRSLFRERPASGVKAVGVSARPRDAEGSYMPCFLAGIAAAEAFASAYGVPLHEFSHQQGHIAAAAYGAGALGLLRQPFLAWHLSGGTTELLYVTPDARSIPQETIVGGTTDIAAGQLVDRAGVAMGLNFPSGPALEALTEGAPPQKGFAVHVEDARFSLSGMENKVTALLASGAPQAEVAAFVIATITRTILAATRQALERYPGLPVLCAGGVMSNRRIQAAMHDAFGAHFAPPAYASDNALGPALLAAIREGEDVWTRR